MATVAILSALIEPIAALTQWVSTTPVHPTFYPFLWISTLHAARISLAYRGRIQSLGHYGKLNRGPEYAGYLLMCWGGGLISHFLVYAPPPQILSAYPTINYLSTHVAVGYALTYLSSVFPTQKTIDTLLPLVDAILRSGAITGSVNLVQSNPNPAISSSLFLQLIIGAIASAGGGVAASTLNVFSPTWSLTTPPFLSGGPVDTLDLWAGSVAAIVYGVFAGTHESYAPLQRFLLETFGGNVSDEVKAASSIQLTSPLYARSASVLVLTGLFAYRTYSVHYATKKVRVPPVKTVKSVKEKDL